MYSASEIKAGLIGLVGWRQNYDPAGEQLSSLTTSTTGLYFNDEHPLLNIENLLSLAPDFDKITSPATDFTGWLQEKTEAGIIRALNAWINLKVKLGTGNNLLERDILFKNANRQFDKDTNSGEIVGLEVKPQDSRGLVYRIERIGLQFDTDQDITVYLFHSEDTTPEQSVTVTYAGGGGLQWETVDWELSHTGAYYIVYDQSQISGQSINGVYDHYSMIPDSRAQYYFPSNKFFTAVGLNVNDSTATTSALWDIADNAYTVSTNYGLNLDINVQCDYTELILEQKDLFATIIAKQVAIDLLHEIALNATARVNRHEANIDAKQVMFDINGHIESNPGGMRAQLKEAIDAIQFDTTGIDRHCLPCRKRGARYKSV